ncbi:MAG: bilirubin oxidase [Chloroflexi bacterium]|nr:MAG: bilirubin oxidase [Chloroflexota bacterium]
MTSRRQFIQVGAAVGVGSLIRWQIDSKGSSLFQAARALAASGQTALLGSRVPQFVTPLPTFNGRRVSEMAMQVGMLEFQQKVLPDSFYASLPAPYNAGTYVWGYKVGNTAPSYPASTIVAKRGTMTFVKYVNSLPITPYLQKSLTIDQTLHWADPLGQMSATQAYAGPQPGVVHMHGAEVPSEYDGVPDAWWTPDGKRGKAYSTMVPTDPNAAVYCYPNRQPATTLWFHDHTLGMTRISVLSGLAGMYLIRDQFDTGLVGNPLGLPAGDQEIELILQDRQFDTNGQWYFPDSTSKGAGLNGDPTNPLIHPNWIPEFFGDTIVVNGRTWPYLEVEPRRYRFRVVNGANARFFRMNLIDSTSAAAGPTIWQIGSDGGQFDRPVKPTDHENLSRLALFMAPGERADIIVDFTGLAGKSFTLTNDAQFPYPSGGPVTAGLDDRVMQFRVTKPLSSRDSTFDPASGGALRGGANQEKAIVRLSNPTTGRLASGVAADVVRQLVLVEVEGNPPAPQPGGPIEVLLNNTRWDGLREGTKEVAGGPGARPDGIGDMVTELPRVGATEVWEIMNLTQDAHPIHLHLIQFQLLNRQQIQTRIDPLDGSAIYAYRATYDSKFPGGKYVGQLADGSWGPTSYAAGNYIPGFGPPHSYTTKNADGSIGGNPAFSPTLVGGTLVPEAGEVGWKDTIKVYPGYVTRIVARWTPQETAVGAAGPGTNLFPFDPTQGPGYVWHCHILDHEDNEMMRPLKPIN